MRSPRAVLGVVALGVAMTMPVTGAAAEETDLSELPPALAADIELMAEQTGASIEELVRHSEIQEDVIELQRRLSEVEGFAGLWYSWDPLAVNVAQAGEGNPAFDEVVDGFPHPDLLAIHQVAWSMQELEEAQHHIGQMVQAGELPPADVMLDIMSNHIALSVDTEEEAVQARTTLAETDPRYVEPSEGGMVVVTAGGRAVITTADAPPLDPPDEPPAAEPRFTG